ncbi:uncharacterized protein LOC109796742 isoform X2 [Cajanus cajan]|uniref:uncharacterized protein LOC109796742 isoform X2 n=1 Tax=Cajanus cajan TaxID=3821 RepID=UPI00098D957E|nr:uncharacterized protein LOC109796742 isoform X2 [Cajanus cajan]
MKLSGKAISSPGRSDKFPPPLMRFLRSNAGSRSRRSRSSPMFVRKKNATTIETQEPSSPKVTCMGQVRVRRSSKQPPTKRDTPRNCCSIRKPNSCRCRPLCLWPFFRRKPKPKPKPNYHPHPQAQESESESAFRETLNLNVDNAFASTSNSSTPPKNALLLTRCRSAPYRSSSLASRFWGSPVNTELPSTDSTSQEPQKLDSLTQPLKLQQLSNGKEPQPQNQTLSPSRPTLLTRCKSEPARTGHRLDSLWKKTSTGSSTIRIDCFGV